MVGELVAGVGALDDVGHGEEHIEARVFVVRAEEEELIDELIAPYHDRIRSHGEERRVVAAHVDGDVALFGHARIAELDAERPLGRLCRREFAPRLVRVGCGVVVGEIELAIFDAEMHCECPWLTVK